MSLSVFKCSKCGTEIWANDENKKHDKIATKQCRCGGMLRKSGRIIGTKLYIGMRDGIGK